LRSNRQFASPEADFRPPGDFFLGVLGRLEQALRNENQEPMIAFTENPRQRSLLLMLLSLLFFAANALLIRGLSLRISGVDGWMALFFRGGTGMVLVLVLYGRGRGLELRPLLANRRVLARGVCGAASILLFYIAIIHLGAGRALVLNLTYPLFGAALAALWLEEALTLRAISWMLAGFGGLLVFFAEGALRRELGIYDLVGVLSAVGAGVAVVLIRGLSKNHHPSTIYASQCVYSLLLAIPVTASAVGKLPAIAWLALTGAGTLVAFGQLALTAGFRHLSVAEGASIQMLLPFLTTVGGYAFFGERFLPWEVAGALLTLFATWQVLRAPAGIDRRRRGPSLPKSEAVAPRSDEAGREQPAEAKR